jgi:hypothetical protein
LLNLTRRAASVFHRHQSGSCWKTTAEGISKAGWGTIDHIAKKYAP